MVAEKTPTQATAPGRSELANRATPEWLSLRAWLASRLHWCGVSAAYLRSVNLSGLWGLVASPFLGRPAILTKCPTKKQVK